MNIAAHLAPLSRGGPLGPLLIIGLMILGSACSKDADRQVATAPPSASATQSSNQDPVAIAKNGMELLHAAKTEGHYFVGLFHQDAAKLDEDLQDTLRETVANPEFNAEFHTVDLTASGQSPIIRHLDLARMPMPVVIVLAPSGAVTKTLPLDDDGNIDIDELELAFVSPAHAKVLSAMQEGKLVVVDLRGSASYANDPMEQVTGIEALFADTEASANLVRVDVNSEQKGEADFLKQFAVADATQGAPKSPLLPTALVLAPPGQELGRLTGKVTKDLLLAITSRYAAP